MAKHNELGSFGEKQAVDLLLQKGYKILDTNWRYQKAEVDIIANKDDILVAVEVKTRTSTDYGDPQDFVNSKKIRLLTKAVDEYIQRRELDVEVRFDIIAITSNTKKLEIEHLKDAFYYF